MFNVPSTVVKAAVPYVVAAAAFGAVGGISYYKGNEHGQTKIQDKWDLAKSAQELEIARLEGRLAEQSRNHANESEKLQQKLEQAEADYDRRMAQFRSTYTRSLLDSEARATRYRELSDAGAAECSALASRAAELDRSLVEGRYVVEQLREVVKQRDSALITIGQQLRLDRETIRDAKSD